MKSYTDIKQSKKLAEFLPLDSADMGYLWNGTSFCEYPVSNQTIFNRIENIPCWSLAALLGVASTYCNRLEMTLRADKKYNVFAVKNDFVFRSFDECSKGYDTPVDACVAMIERLNELKML